MSVSVRERERKRNKKYKFIVGMFLSVEQVKKTDRDILRKSDRGRVCGACRG